MNKFWRGLFDLILLAVIAAGGYFAVTHHNQILDWYYLRNYTPPARIAELADQPTLTDSAKHLLYRARPQIDPDRQSLVQDCRIPSDRTIELGCYLSNDRIYLLDIDQSTLSSQMAVTTAHETLHAAYDRLSKTERAHIDSLLEQAVSTIHDEDLDARMADYAQTEPGARDNELHSILGSEFGNLPPELEQYYQQYFTNRAAVVALSDKFKQTFNGLHDEITRLGASITARRAEMKALLAARQVGRYNALVPVVNADIDRYNADVDQYNRYASELLGTQTTEAAQ